MKVFAFLLLGTGFLLLSLFGASRIGIFDMKKVVNYFLNEDQNLKNVVLNASNSEVDINASMKSLAKKKDPWLKKHLVAETKSIHLLSPAKQSRFIESLAEYNDTATSKAIFKLLNNKNDLVRKHAIYAISRSPLPGTDEALLKHFKRFKRKDRPALYYALYKISKDPKIKEKSKNYLITTAVSGKGPISLEAYKNALSLLSRHKKELIKVSQKILEAELSPQHLAEAINFLAFENPEYLKKVNLLKLSKWGDDLLRRSILLTLPILCPANKWKILGNIIRSKPSFYTKTVIYKTVKKLGGSRSKAFLSKYSSHLKKASKWRKLAAIKEAACQRP